MIFIGIIFFPGTDGWSKCALLFDKDANQYSIRISHILLCSGIFSSLYSKSLEEQYVMICSMISLQTKISFKVFWKNTQLYFTSVSGMFRKSACFFLSTEKISSFKIL